jgi:hypothetical protein
MQADAPMGDEFTSPTPLSLRPGSLFSGEENGTE